MGSIVRTRFELLDFFQNLFECPGYGDCPFLRIVFQLDPYLIPHVHAGLFAHLAVDEQAVFSLPDRHQSGLEGMFIDGTPYWNVALSLKGLAHPFWNIYAGVDALFINEG